MYIYIYIYIYKHTNIDTYICTYICMYIKYTKIISYKSPFYNTLQYNIRQYILQSTHSII